MCRRRCGRGQSPRVACGGLLDAEGESKRLSPDSPSTGKDVQCESGMSKIAPEEGISPLPSFDDDDLRKEEVEGDAVGDIRFPETAILCYLTGGTGTRR